MGDRKGSGIRGMGMDNGAGFREGLVDFGVQPPLGRRGIVTIHDFTVQFHRHHVLRQDGLIRNGSRGDGHDARFRIIHGQISAGAGKQFLGIGLLRPGKYFLTHFFNCFHGIPLFEL